MRARRTIAHARALHSNALCPGITERTSTCTEAHARRSAHNHNHIITGGHSAGPWPHGMRCPPSPPRHGAGKHLHAHIAAHVHSELESHAKHGPIATHPAGKETRDLAEQHSMRQWATSSTNMKRRSTMGHPGLKRAQLGDQSMCTGLGGEARTPARYALLALAPCISDGPDAHIHNRCRAFSSCNKLHALACLLAQPATGGSWRDCTTRSKCLQPRVLSCRHSQGQLLQPNGLSTQFGCPKQTLILVSYSKRVRCEVDRNS